MKEKILPQKYDAKSIDLLSSLEGIRKRPEMYIGNISDGNGLHHIIFEILNNSIDEVIIGECNKIWLSINKDNSISIKDNGRGIPTEIKFNDIKIIKRSAAEIVLTEMHSGGKFDNKNYSISGGMHGIGLTCVNALSKWLKLIIYNKKIYFLKFENGVIQNKFIEKINNILVSKMKILNKTNKRGTEITFLPDITIFKSIDYNEELLKNFLKELCYLNKKLKIFYLNKKNNNLEKFYFKNGIKDFIKNFNNEKKINKNILYNIILEENKSVEIALQWNEKHEEKIFCYTNNIYQKNGGVHMIILKTVITKTFNKYIFKNILKKHIEIIGEDIRDGLVCILSLKTPSPKFDSQTKTKLVSEGDKIIIENCISNLLENFFNENKLESKIICQRIIKIAKIRNLKKFMKESEKNMFKKINNFPNKIANCQEINPDKSEIFIVEGDSAGGSAKQCRDRKFQAIFPLKGKILNVEKAKYKKLIKSEQIINLLNSLGCEIKNNFNMTNVRYKKIIIMTDADTDGAHIRTLLLTFFYRYIPKVLEMGYVYIAQPPLYKANYKKRDIYFKNINKLNLFIMKLTFKELNKNYLKLENDLLRKYKKFTNLYINFQKEMNNLKKNFIINFIIDFVMEGNKIYINKIYLALKTGFLIKKRKIKKNKFIKIELIIINIKKIFFKIYIVKFKTIIKKILLDKKLLKKIKYKNLIFLSLKINNIVKKNYKNKEIFNFKKLIKNLIKKIKKNINLQRYKGLGEMNPIQLWKTTMNPKKRKLIKIYIKNKKNTNKIFLMLMGKEIKNRKIFIKKNSLKIKNLDI